MLTGARSPSGVPILANDPHRRIEMPALRYFVHLVAPGWNVIGGGEPPFAGVDAGSNEHMAWGFTFAGTDMVDVYVEELHPEDPNLVRWQDGWEPLRVIEEEIPVKGQESEPVVLKFSRHGPVFYEDLENGVAYAVRSVVQEPGTAAYKGSFQLAQAESCADFFERAMHWLVPTHSLVCGDADGNIALQVTGLTPDRDGWNGRLPVPGNGDYEWRRVPHRPAAGVQPGARLRGDRQQQRPPARLRGAAGLLPHVAAASRRRGSPVCTRSSAPARCSRWTTTSGSSTTPGCSRPSGTSRPSRAGRRMNPDVEWARGLIAEWDATVSRESTAGALYVRWNAEVDDAVRDPDTAEADRRGLIEAGLTGGDRGGSPRSSAPTGPSGGTAGCTPASCRTCWRLRSTCRPWSVPAASVPSTPPAPTSGASSISRTRTARWPATPPGSRPSPAARTTATWPRIWGNGEYFPLLYTRGAVEERAAHRLALRPADE